MTDHLRVVIASVGWTGHAYPAFALARELCGRGHDVTVETFERWREVVEGIGARFMAAEEQMVFSEVADRAEAPTLAQAARALAPTLGEIHPHVVVSDLFTLAPALAAEVAGIRRATLIPHPYPVREPGLPFYPLGLLPPRTPGGSLAWRLMWPAVGTRLPNTKLRAIRAGLDRTRAELGLGPLAGYDGQISEQLAMVATFPQLEYPRRWPATVHVTGPMPFELPHPAVELPHGKRPLVLIAPSTERDPEQRLLRVALEALASEPVRVIATTNRRGSGFSDPVPANATVVDWLSYAEVMASAAAVICHGGHGTITRALAAGVPVLISPPAGDMAENGARVTWARAGLMLPNRLLGVAPLRVAARRLLGDPDFAKRAGMIAAWARRNDGAANGADLVEGLAR